MKTAQKILTFLLVSMMTLVGVSQIKAGQLQSIKDQVGDSRPSVATWHKFTFTLETTDTYKEFRFDFCKEASGGCTTPDGFTAVNSTLTAANTTGFATIGNWEYTTEAGYVILNDIEGAGESMDSGDVLVIEWGVITNSQIAANCDGDSNTSSDSCFVQVDACGSVPCGSDQIDEGTTTYTVVNAIVVTARVDPTFKFTVTAVSSTTATNATGTLTTTVNSTASTLPFGNLTAETPAFAAHELQVITNTNSGYTVTMKALQPSEGEGVMQGVYTANNIDPYAGGTWANPTDWTQPTGDTYNIDTGWLGANTDDTDIISWDGDAGEGNVTGNEFGPVSTTAVTVMRENSSDDGSTTHYVTYAIEANVFQPADTYTGTILYYALPTY